MLKTLFGFLPPRTGRITLRGQDISAQPSHERARHGVAFVPQHRSLFGELSVHDNLLLGCWPFRQDKARVRRRIESVYERFPILAQKRDDPVSSMSGGQQRFVEFGRALLIEPSVILLDETAMLAPRISKEIYALIRGFADEGMTVVLVDQNVRRCAEISDYMYILELGRNKAEGSRGPSTRAAGCARWSRRGWTTRSTEGPTVQGRTGHGPVRQSSQRPSEPLFYLGFSHCGPNSRQGA